MSESRLRRTAVEGLIILVSILLAFGIDAWWDSVREAGEAAQRLRSAQEELAAASPKLLAEAEYQGRVVGATQELIRLVTSVAEGESVLTPDTLWAAALSAPDVAVATAAVEALASAGTLAHVERRSLRDSLGAWPSYLSDALANQEEQWRFVTEEFGPILRSRADLRTGFSLVRPWVRQEVPATHVASMVRVVRDLEVTNALAEREMNAAMTRGDYEDLSRHTLALASSLGSALAR